MEALMHFFKLDTFRSAVRTLLLLLVFSTMATAQSEKRIYIQARYEAIQEFMQGHFDRAETLFVSAFHGAEVAHDDFVMALSLSGLGDVYHNENRLDESTDCYRRSLSLLRARPNSTFAVAIVLRNLGSAYLAAGRYRDAQKTLVEASQLAQRIERPSPQLTGQILNSLGMLYYYQGNLGKATSLFEAALQAYSRAEPPLSTDLGQSMNNLAGIRWQKHRFKEAEDLYRQSVALAEKDGGKFHPDLILILNNLGDLYLELKRYDEAEVTYRKTLSIMEKMTPSPVDRSVHSLYGLGQVYLKRDQMDHAEQVLARATDVAATSRVAIAELPAILETYSKLLDSIGKRQQAQDVRSKALRTRAARALTVRLQDLN
jgi:tetratricopeptide (TPR) repeat protein